MRSRNFGHKFVLSVGGRRAEYVFPAREKLLRSLARRYKGNQIRSKRIEFGLLYGLKILRQAYPKIPKEKINRLRREIHIALEKEIQKKGLEKEEFSGVVKKEVEKLLKMLPKEQGEFFAEVIEQIAWSVFL